MPFFQGVVCDADAQDRPNFHVLEADANCVSGQDFGEGLDFSESDPGEDDEKGDCKQNPECGSLDHNDAQRICSRDFRLGLTHQQDFYPKQAD